METLSTALSFVTQKQFPTEGRFQFKEENIANNSQELSCFIDQQASEHVYTFHITLLLIISTFCITSNSLVIYTILNNKKLLTPNNAFILSLAISDLLYGFTFALYNMAHVDFAQRALGHWMVCCPLLTLLIAAQMASSNNLIGVSVVRYIMVKHPLRFQRMLTKSQMFKGVAGAWVTSFICAAVFYARPEPDEYCGICRTELFWKLHDIIIWLLFTTVLPLLIMIALYVELVKAYQTQVIQVSNYLRRKEQKMIKNRKSLNKVSLILVFYFAMSYTPFAVFVLLYQFCDCNIGAYIRVMVRMIYFSCTTVNFFVYMLGYKEFRLAFMKNFCRRKRDSMRRFSSGPVNLRNNSPTDCLSSSECTNDITAQHKSNEMMNLGLTDMKGQTGPAGDVYVIRL